MNRSHLAGLLALTLASVGCNTDPAVFVDAELAEPSLQVTGGALGATLTGSFALTLHLGARASGPSEVTYGAFSLQTADGTVLVDSLPVTPDQASPVTVDPDTTETVTFAIDSGDEPLPAELVDQICAGQVVVAGVIEDSLESGSSPLESAPFAAAGCP